MGVQSRREVGINVNCEFVSKGFVEKVRVVKASSYACVTPGEVGELSSVKRPFGHTVQDKALVGSVERENGEILNGSN